MHTYMVSCPTRSKNLGRTLMGSGPYLTNFRQIPLTLFHSGVGGAVYPHPINYSHLLSNEIFFFRFLPTLHAYFMYQTKKINLPTLLVYSSLFFREARVSNFESPKIPPNQISNILSESKFLELGIEKCFNVHTLKLRSVSTWSG